MAAVLGIDAAWTERNASGYALVEEIEGRWRLKAAAPDIAAFAEECGLPYEEGGAGFALRCAERKLGGRLPEIVAVDMPLSRLPITGRRASDLGVSRRFGAPKCATHSPSADRPGIVSGKLHAACKARGYSLLTARRPEEGRWLAEVYPHPALLRLMGAEERLPYKVNKTLTYWPNKTPQERLARVKLSLRGIVERLDEEIDGVVATIDRAFDLEGAERFSVLKPLEDTIDAIVAAWVGITILQGAAEPIGDADSAIWIPAADWASMSRVLAEAAPAQRLALASALESH